MSHLKNKYRALLGAFSQQSILPSGYKLCEYLESTGTQYFNSLVYPNNKTSLEVKFQVDSLTRSQFVGVTDGSNRLSVLLPATGTGYLVNQIGNINKILSSLQIKLKVGDVATIKNDKGNLYFNGQLVDSVTPNSFRVSFVLRIFGQGGASNQIAVAKIYYVSIWDNDVLVQNLIPCLDNNDRPCMYDTVSKQTFYNQGTGEFSYKLAENSGGTKLLTYLLNLIKRGLSR